VGVAPKARIMPLKFLNVTGSGDTMNAVEAIHYAVANGARIISASWGGAGRSEFLAQAVADAQAAGVIFVAAAGNAAWDIDSTPTYPAAFDGVVTVASTGPTDVMSSFSNFGPAHVMLSAPGEAIWSSLLKLHWGNLSGTSMATPHVSGALALALAVRPDLTVAQLKQALCDTAAPVNQDKVKCGRLDVGALVSSLAPPSSS
jgi:subtilisin family serine protease